MFIYRAGGGPQSVALSAAACECEPSAAPAPALGRGVRGGLGMPALDGRAGSTRASRPHHRRHHHHHAQDGAPPPPTISFTSIASREPAAQCQRVGVQRPLPQCEKLWSGPDHPCFACILGCSAATFYLQGCLSCLHLTLLLPLPNARAAVPGCDRRQHQRRVCLDAASSDPAGSATRPVLARCLWPFSTFCRASVCLSAAHHHDPSRSCALALLSPRSACDRRDGHPETVVPACDDTRNTHTRTRTWRNLPTACCGFLPGTPQKLMPSPCLSRLPHLTSHLQALSVSCSLSRIAGHHSSSHTLCASA